MTLVKIYTKINGLAFNVIGALFRSRSFRGINSRLN